MPTKRHKREWNSGLRLRPPKANDWFAGGLSGVTDRPILQNDRDWREHLPEQEKQSWAGGDSMACVTFSALNVYETLLDRKFGIVSNFSDRFTAKMSGTTQYGNYLTAVAECIRKSGLINEEVWPVVSPFVWDEYYTEIPDDIKKMALDSLKLFKFSYEWVYPDFGMGFDKALEYAPIQVAMEYAPDWSKDGDGRYLWRGGSANHAVTLVRSVEGVSRTIFDHYDVSLKELRWDYPLEVGLLLDVHLNSIDPPPMYEFQENHRYFLADAGGATLFYLGGKLRKDDLAKCLDQWIGRNDGDLTGKSHTITTAELSSTPLYDLSGNPVSL